MPRPVNAIRAEGCGSKLGPQPALRTNAALSRAAEALAAGRNFKDAMSASGYRAAQSAMLKASPAAQVRPASFSSSTP